MGDPGSIPGSGRSPGEGNGNLLQYSCLENPWQRSLLGHSLWGRKESGMTEQISVSSHQSVCSFRAESTSCTYSPFLRAWHRADTHQIPLQRSRQWQQSRWLPLTWTSEASGVSPVPGLRVPFSLYSPVHHSSHSPHFVHLPQLSGPTEFYSTPSGSFPSWSISRALAIPQGLPGSQWHRLDQGGLRGALAPSCQRLSALLSALSVLCADLTTYWGFF